VGVACWFQIRTAEGFPASRAGQIVTLARSHPTKAELAYPVSFSRADEMSTSASSLPQACLYEEERDKVDEEGMLFC